MRKVFPIIVLVALMAGLLGQFGWKMIYFPEPLIPVIFEVSGIVILSGLAIWCVATARRL